MQRAPTLGLLLALAALFLLAAAALVASGLNGPVFLAINAAGARWLPVYLPSCLTLLGNGLAAVMLLALLLGRAPQILAAGLNAAPLAGALSAMGKRLAQSPRPAAVLDPTSFHVQGPLLSGHNGFPSGHTITIFLVATVVLLGLEPARRRWPTALAVLGVAVMVGVSRVMVGAHWPSDILGGAALGIVSGLAGDALARRWRYWHHCAARVGMGIIVLGCALALGLVDTGYPLAVPLQWTLVVAGAASAICTLALQWRAHARRRRESASAAAPESAPDTPRAAP